MIYIGVCILISMEKVNPKENKVEQDSTSNPSLASLLRQAESVGHSEVPTSVTELESKIQYIFDNSGKIMSAKEVFGIIKERDAKYYSDKLWYMARAGKLVKIPNARGWYQSAKHYKKQ